MYLSQAFVLWHTSRHCIEKPTPYIVTESSLGATHRGTHRFVPRHSDEMAIEIGDSIHVLDEAEDGWCMGMFY